VDDADVSLLGRRCRGFASRGQRKVLLLAWKMAEAADVSARTGEWPLLVLDDALADLDATRQGRVVECLGASRAQVFVTSAVAPPGLPAAAAVFRATGGTFAPVGG
jgi:DNA replication and repair protein RecF